MSDSLAMDRRRRARSPKHFDTHFRFALSNEVLSKSKINELITHSGDPGFVQQELCQAVKVMRPSGDTQATLLLDALITHAEEVPEENVVRNKNLVDTQLGAVLKAIRHGLGRPIDRHGNSLNRVVLDPGGQDSVVRPDDAETNRRLPGYPFFGPDRDPDLVWCLSGKTVELQRGQETDDPVRQGPACLDEAVVCRDVGIGGLVESPCDAHEAALPAQALEIGPDNAGGRDVAGAHDACGVGQGQDALPRAHFMHDDSCYNISVRRDKSLGFVTLREGDWLQAE
jgi:hypothetical protein